MMGNRDARVTMPNPESDEFCLPADAAIPMPSESTRGTVTGPVVTAPVSHARPRISLSSGMRLMYAVSPIVGTKDR
jgi:hypothetical protein